MSKTLSLVVIIIIAATHCLVAVTAAVATRQTAAAQQSGEKHNDITGTWLFEVETSVGAGSPTFIFKQAGERLTGQYKGAFGEAPVTGTLTGTAIKFSFAVDAGGAQTTIIYTGTIDKDTMKGTLEAGDAASGTWRAKRQQTPNKE